MNLTFSVTTLLAIVISTATAQEQVYNQIHASRGATPGASAAGGGYPYQHQHHDHERQQQQQEQRAQQLRGGRGGRHPSTSLLEAVEVSCSNTCGNSDDCCPGYTCQAVGSLFTHLGCVPS
jgi:hypothetical protein